MATMIIRDDALWAKHIEGDPELARRISALAEGERILLAIEGRPLRFRKMRDGTDGRPTDGLRPDDASLPDWRDFQERRGERVRVELGDRPAADPYLLALTTTLTEWNSPEDAAAYDGL